MPKIYTSGGTAKVKSLKPAKPVKVKQPNIAYPTSAVGASSKAAAPVAPKVSPKKTAATAGEDTGAGAGADTSDPLGALVQQLLGQLLNPTAAPAVDQGKLLEQAKTLIDAAYAPQRDLLNQQIKQANDLGLARAQQLKDVWGGFAQYLGGQPGPGQQAFQQSANTMGSFNQGYTDGLRMMGAATGGQLDKQLGYIGAPGGQYSGAQPGGQDFGAANWIQSTGAPLVQADQASAAAMGQFGADQPRIAALMGTYDTQQVLNEAAQQVAELQKQFPALAAQEASAVADFGMKLLQSQQDASAGPDQADTLKLLTTIEGIREFNQSSDLDKQKFQLELNKYNASTTPGAEPIDVGVSKLLGVLSTKSGPVRNPKTNKPIPLPAAAAAQRKPSIWKVNDAISRSARHIVETDQYGNERHFRNRPYVYPGRPASQQPPKWKVDQDFSRSSGKITLVDQFGHRRQTGQKYVAPGKPGVDPVDKWRPAPDSVSRSNKFVTLVNGVGQFKKTNIPWVEAPLPGGKVISDPTTFGINYKGAQDFRKVFPNQTGVLKWADPGQTPVAVTPSGAYEAGTPENFRAHPDWRPVYIRPPAKVHKYKDAPDRVSRAANQLVKEDEQGNYFYTGIPYKAPARAPRMTPAEIEAAARARAKGTASVTGPAKAAAGAAKTHAGLVKSMNIDMIAAAKFIAKDITTRQFPKGPAGLEAAIKYYRDNWGQQYSHRYGQGARTRLTQIVRNAWKYRVAKKPSTAGAGLPPWATVK